MDFPQWMHEIKHATPEDPYSFGLFVIALVSGVVSLISVFFTILAWRFARKDAKSALDLQKTSTEAVTNSAIEAKRSADEAEKSVNALQEANTIYKSMDRHLKENADSTSAIAQTGTFQVAKNMYADIHLLFNIVTNYVTYNTGDKGPLIVYRVNLPPVDLFRILSSIKLFDAFFGYSKIHDSVETTLANVVAQRLFHPMLDFNGPDTIVKTITYFDDDKDKGKIIERFLYGILVYLDMYINNTTLQLSKLATPQQPTPDNTQPES